MNLKNLSGNRPRSLATVEMVEKALEALTHGQEARRYHIPPVEDFSQVRMGRLQDNRAADFAVSLEDPHGELKEHRNMYFVLIDTLDARPSRHWRRRMIAQAKQDGAFFPRLLLYPMEKFASIKKKVAQVIRVFVNSLKRAADRLRHDENRGKRFKVSYRTSRQRIACAHCFA